MKNLKRVKKRAGRKAGHEKSRSMNIKELSLLMPVEEKIAWAQSCYNEIADSIKKDKQTAGLLVRLEKAISESSKKRAAAGIVEICRKCEDIEGGSCCGAGIENRYDGRLLLINLLLGVTLPHQRRDPESCFFLGRSGCVLHARHVICINYFCRKITDKIDPVRLASLREKEGEEVEALFLLNERIITILSSYKKATHKNIKTDNSPIRKKTDFRNALERVAMFYDRRKTGDVGPLGFRRPTDMEVLLDCTDRLLSERIVVPSETRFLDLGCADGRVNVFFSYLVRISAGIEIDEWTLQEYAPLKSGLEKSLKKDGLELPPDNIFLFNGDALDEKIHEKIKASTGLAFEDFNLFYTYLVMHREFASLIRQKARSGSVYMVYGLDNIIPRYKGFRLLKHLSPMQGILALYQKK